MIFSFKIICAMSGRNGHARQTKLEGTNLMYEDDYLESDYEDRYTIQGDIDNEDRADYQDYLDAQDEQPEPDEEDNGYFSDGTPIPDEPFTIVASMTYDPETDTLYREDGTVVEDDSDILGNPAMSPMALLITIF